MSRDDMGTGDRGRDSAELHADVDRTPHAHVASPMDAVEDAICEVEEADHLARQSAWLAAKGRAWLPEAAGKARAARLVCSRAEHAAEAAEAAAEESEREAEGHPSTLMAADHRWTAARLRKRTRVLRGMITGLQNLAEELHSAEVKARTRVVDVEGQAILSDSDEETWRTTFEHPEYDLEQATRSRRRMDSASANAMSKANDVYRQAVKSVANANKEAIRAREVFADSKRAIEQAGLATNSDMAVAGHVTTFRAEQSAIEAATTAAEAAKAAYLAMSSAAKEADLAYSMAINATVAAEREATMREQLGDSQPGRLYAEYVPLAASLRGWVKTLRGQAVSLQKRAAMLRTRMHAMARMEKAWNERRVWDSQGENGGAGRMAGS